MAKKKAAKKIAKRPAKRVPKKAAKPRAAILTNFWAKLSVLLVVLALGFAVLGSKLIGEQHRDRINYAEADAARWSREFAATAGKRDPWPFTSGIERLASYLRDAKTWLPLSAGVSFVIALFARSRPGVAAPVSAAPG